MTVYIVVSMSSDGYYAGIEGTYFNRGQALDLVNELDRLHGNCYEHLIEAVDVYE